MNFDFDTWVDRRNTSSFKWDMNMEYFGRDDIIPMWVADMDFPCAPAVVEAIKARAEHPIYGYTVRKQDYYEAVIGWLKRRHHFEVKQEWLAFAPPGVIYAIYVILQLLTEKGDKVIIPMPNYDPLFDVIVKSGRTMVETPLILKDERFTFDFDDLRKKAKQGAKALILSSPHNPTGRVWTKQELSELASICLENDIYMLIDEIHADLVPNDRIHTTFGLLGEEVLQKSIVCYSANKGFNLGGLQMSTVVIADENLRERFNEQMLIAQTRLDNTFGAVAMIAAYNHGEQWLDAVMDYVRENKVYLQDYLEKRIPKIKMIPSEGTYLVWLDCSALGLEGKELESFMIQKAKIAFCAGYEFGESGKSYVRMNVSCPRSILKKALEQLENAIF